MALHSTRCLRHGPRLARRALCLNGGSHHRQLVTLAIETSCDDTAVAVLEHVSNNNNSSSSSSGGGGSGGDPLLETHSGSPPPPRTRLLFNKRISSDLRAYRGIRPATALESHQRTLAGLVREAIPSIPTRNSHRGGGGGGADQQGIPDFVSVTRGPGIHANLATGLFTAKGLALAWGVPLVGLHHMQAHALTPRLVRALGMPMAGEEGRKHHGDDSNNNNEGRLTPEFPFLTLLVSGGHSQLVLSAGLTDHRVLATTTDAAIGNVLDQAARVILPEDVLAACPDVMYGRHLEAYAFPCSTAAAAPSSSSSSSSSSSLSDSDSYSSFFSPPRSRAEELADTPTGYPWTVSPPMRATRRLAYSFSAIHSAVHAIAAERGGGGAGAGQPFDDAERRALARHTQRAAFQHLASRLCLALEEEDDDSDSDKGSTRQLARRARTLVVAGGVACNKFLMHVLRTTLEARGLLVVPAAAAGGGGGDESQQQQQQQRRRPGLREIIAPPVALCTDNAAMIAWAGMEMFEAGWRTDLDVGPVTKWPLDPRIRLPDKSGGGPGGLMEIGGWSRWK